MYSATSPKLKTSLVKGLLEVIFLFLVRISSGARKGTVPRIVAYSKLSFSTTLQLPTSHSFIVSLWLFIISMF